MIHPILRYPAKRLRLKSEPVTDFGEPLQELVRDLFETMVAAKGLGLAAIQIGVPKRVSVLWLSSAPLVLVNPKLVEYSEPKEVLEGCLSIPGASCPVRRYMKIKVEAFDERGEPIVVDSIGSDAQAIQHELSHLAGGLYIDLIRPNRRQNVIQKSRTAVPPYRMALV